MSVKKALVDQNFESLPAKIFWLKQFESPIHSGESVTGLSLFKREPSIIIEFKTYFSNVLLS
jgi:hypothetical protein